MLPQNRRMLSQASLWAPFTTYLPMHDNWTKQYEIKKTRCYWGRLREHIGNLGTFLGTWWWEHIEYHWVIFLLCWKWLIAYLKKIQKKKRKLVNKISNSKVHCKFAKEKEWFFIQLNLVFFSIKLILIAIYYFHVGLFWRCSNAKIKIKI
jgi:hypothetical protein